MSHESNKALLKIETHTLPDDYPFSVDELDRIIAGEVVSPHQAAIMARELKKRRQAETSTPVEDDYLANMLWYAEESVCHPDPNSMPLHLLNATRSAVTTPSGLRIHSAMLARLAR